MEQLIAHVKRLGKLAEDMHEREISPAAFFGEAFDMTGRIQALLHRMEVSKLAQFERQIKVYQAHIQSIERIPEYSALPSGTPRPSPVPVPESAPQEILPPPVPPATEKPAVASPPPSPLRTGTPLPSPPPPPKRTAEKTDGWLNETIEKNRLADLRKAFTLNDRFRFCRDLFGKDESLMDRTVAELNVMESYEASVAYLRERFNWNFEDGTVAEFVATLEKRFS
ncbi:MAG: hypothetical protein LBL42_05250 [Tannerella sp.]|nr:hypothetical protein [Tannerella sp.]